MKAKRLKDILEATAIGFSSGTPNSPEGGFLSGLGKGFSAARAIRKDNLEAAEAVQKELEAKEKQEKVASFRDRLQKAPKEQRLEIVQEYLMQNDPLQFARMQSQDNSLSERLGSTEKTAAEDRDVRLKIAEMGERQRRDLAAEKEAERKQRDLETRTQKFSKTIEDLGIPEAITQFRGISNALPASGDIPGFGVGESLIPSALLGPKARGLRQAVAGLQNVKIKDRSGAAVTPPEFVRLAEEFGTGKFKSEDQLRQGLQQAVSAYLARAKNAYGGFGQDVRDQFYGNQGIEDYVNTLGSFNFNPQKEPSGQTQKAKTVVQNGITYTLNEATGQYE